MRILGKLGEQQYKIPVYSASDIADGALMMPGITAETDLGVAILSDATGADAFGFMSGTYDVSVEGTSSVAGTTWVTKLLKPCFEATLCRAEIDQTDTVAVTSYSAPTVTISSLEDDIDTSWLYTTSGTGLGQLEFVTTSASGSCTVKTAFTTALDNTTYLVKIPRIFHQVVKPNSAMTKLGTDAAAGTWTVCVIQTWISRLGNLELLNPTTHAGLTGLNASSQQTAFYADFVVRNNCAYTVD
uniref:Tail protein n=1 Tax=viral metagenome TaxID=1070528 RepID=A0A6H1ZX50_9ZZZZ